MKSIEELKEIRERNLGDVYNRGEKGIPTINVHMETCGIAAGAREVLLAVLDEIRVQQFLRVHVVQSACHGTCENEPMMTVTMPGEEPCVYAKLTPDHAKRVLVSHVINNEPVQEWLLKDGN